MIKEFNCLFSACFLRSLLISLSVSVIYWFMTNDPQNLIDKNNSDWLVLKILGWMSCSSGFSFAHSGGCSQWAGWMGAWGSWDACMGGSVFPVGLSSLSSLSTGLPWMVVRAFPSTNQASALMPHWPKPVTWPSYSQCGRRLHWGFWEERCIRTTQVSPSQCPWAHSCLWSSVVCCYRMGSGARWPGS